jgi:hypothetical protein
MRLPHAGVLILTCWAAVLLLLLLLLIVCNKLGSEQRIWGEDLRFVVGGVSLRWGRRGAGRRGRGRGLVVPWKWRSAQPGLLGLQQPARRLLVLSAPLSFQAAVIPFFLSPLFFSISFYSLLFLATTLFLLS